MLKSQFPSEMLQRIERCGVIAVLVIDDVKDAVPLAEALLAGGIDVMELTLRTDEALPALREVAQNAPSMLAGIGTILTPQQVDQVVEAGAAFGVAPGLSAAVVRHAQSKGLPFAPGVVTPSDVEAGIALGCRELKFFPAEPSGGMSYFNSMTAPYAHVGLSFIPLGGVNLSNMPSYLASDMIPAVGGSWIAPRKLIASHDWDAIRAIAAESRRAVDAHRQGS